MEIKLRDVRQIADDFPPWSDVKFVSSSDHERVVGELKAEIERLRYCAESTGCTCTTYGSVSFPPQPTDHYSKHWCGRCRALGLDKQEPSVQEQQKHLAVVFGAKP